MPKPFVADTAHSHESWAEVRAHDQVMRYRRSGVGRTVLVLRSADESAATWPVPLWPELVDALGAGYRVIVPEPPAGETDLAGWLANFLEGLGVSNVGIVAGVPFCIPALELALLEGDQVARIVLVPDGGGRAVEAGGTIVTATRQARVPLLVVQRGQPAHEAVPSITAFLGAVSVSPS